MQELLNTLYVSTQNAYIHLDHDTLRVEVERETRLRVPLIHLAGIICFGDVLVSPALIHRTSDDGRFLVWLDRNGRFKARMEGRCGGFLYALLRTDCDAAIQGVGLDPQVGYLHALRPGRAALALDLMEELRAAMVDRLALTLINRRQLQLQDFVERHGDPSVRSSDG